jgi:hypothetical protein
MAIVDAIRIPEAPLFNRNSIERDDASVVGAILLNVEELDTALKNANMQTPVERQALLLWVGPEAPHP